MAKPEIYVYEEQKHITYGKLLGYVLLLILFVLFNLYILDEYTKQLKSCKFENLYANNKRIIK